MIRKKSKLAILIHEYSVVIFDLSARPQFAPNFRCKKRGAPLPPPESDSTSQNRFKVTDGALQEGCPSAAQRPGDRRPVPAPAPVPRGAGHRRGVCVGSSL